MNKYNMCLLLMITGLLGCSVKQNTESVMETGGGWSLLFDGKSISGWRGYMGSDIAASWSVKDGVLALKGGNAKGSYVNIISEKQFDDFELSWEWKLEAGSNTGLMFHVKEGPQFPYLTGPEYQILDNKGFRNGKGEPEQTNEYTASHYAIEEAYEDASNPIGKWNNSRIKVVGDNVVYWLNGVKTAEYVMHSDKWNKQVAAAKFGKWPLFGTTGEGHIALQDHGHSAWFRNMKIRDL